MALSESQMVVIAIDEMIDTVSNQTPMARRTRNYTPPGREMQRTDNQIWMPLQQEAPTQKGWDLTGQETDVLSLAVSVSMGEPDNDFFSLRADQIRDETSFRERIRASGVKLANNIEKNIADVATEMGSLVVTSPDPISQNMNGWNFVASAEELLYSRELNRDQGTSYFFNPTDYREAGYSLVNKNVYGEIQDDAYRNGEIQKQVAGFDSVLRTPKLSMLNASEATGVTVVAAQSFKPVATEAAPDGGERNVDNRFATITVSSGTGFKRGDKISFAGVKFISQLAKDLLTQDATFSIVAVNGNDITVTPKPIALDDTTLTAAQRAYANVNTTIAAGNAINILNTESVKPNVFWADDSIRLVSQPIPLTHELFSGMRAKSFDIPDVGVSGVVAFQGDISTLAGKCRIAVWYQANATRPESIGVGLANQS